MTHRTQPRLTPNANAGCRSLSALASEPPTTKAEDMEMNTLDNKHINGKNADDEPPPAPAAAHKQANVSLKQEGLKLLFAASQIEAYLEDKDADAEANSAEAQAEAPSSSSSTAVSNGTVAGAVDLESRISKWQRNRSIRSSFSCLRMIPRPRAKPSLPLRTRTRPFLNSYTGSLPRRSVNPSFTGFPMASRSLLRISNDSVARFSPRILPCGLIE